MTATHTPAVGALAGWIRTWVGERGEIRGFHNHSVWGTNPATFLDFTSGHQAFAAPALVAFSQALAECPDERGLTMWRRMMAYQAHEVQDDGQFQHIGFQVGESATAGLIHNMVGCIGLLEGIRIAGHLLDPDEVRDILMAVRRNLDACKVYGGGRPTAHGTVNQEYARIWAKLRYTELSEDAAFDAELEEDLDRLVALAHLRGVPDEGCIATYRQPTERATGGILEPAEYYGLMMVPLVLGARRFERPDLREEALGLARHVARSAWIDRDGFTRFHRYWYVRGPMRRISTSPMLIAGMGLSLYGIDELLADTADAELSEFVDACMRTYAGYQAPAGFFVSATGWHAEADVSPSTAWHAHDLMLLMRHQDVTPGFWDEVFAPRDRQAVMLSDRAVWSERGDHWAIQSPLTAGDLSIFGRKDRDAFGRSYFAWTDKEPLREELEYPGPPVFFVADDGIYRVDDDDYPTDVTVIGPLPYRGHIRSAG